MQITYFIAITEIIEFAEILSENDIKHKITDVDSENEIITIDVSFNRDNEDYIHILSELALVD